jgi:DNA polymerase elongation subunit (family B)
MKDTLIIDIETRPDPRIWDDPDTVEEIRDSITPPKNYKDPLKIEAYTDERLGELKMAAALRPQMGKIACIGVLPLDCYSPSDPIEMVASQVECPVGDDEFSVLTDFVDVLEGYDWPLIGGYYLREFDVPFISYRCAVHRIDLPDWWPSRRDWSGIIDPCDLFPRQASGSLADNLRAMGLPRKTLTGEESLTLPLDDLADYCRNDVAVEAALIHRLRSQFPALSPRKALNA